MLHQRDKMRAASGVEELALEACLMEAAIKDLAVALGRAGVLEPDIVDFLVATEKLGFGNRSCKGGPA